MDVIGKWKKKTIKRDKCCQICGCSDQNKLEVHHILARSLHPEFKGEDWNLITLCHDCHMYLHEVIMPEDKPNYCNFLSIVELFVHRGNKSKWQKKGFIRDILEKAKRGEYNG